MQKAIKSTLFKTMICTGLCAATFGSFKFAQARIQTQTIPMQVLKLPKELGSWKTFESAFDITKEDVVARKYINKNNEWIGVLVRTNLSNAVLHDLTSCLINADAKPVVEGEEHLPTESKTLNASLVDFQIKNSRSTALMWFQHGDQSAANRWSWRLISTTSASVREAPLYYQVEITTTTSSNKEKDLARLKEVALLTFNELLKHN